MLSFQLRISRVSPVVENLQSIKISNGVISVIYILVCMMIHEFKIMYFLTKILSFFVMYQIQGKLVLPLKVKNIRLKSS